MLSGIAAARGIALINAVGKLGGFLGPTMFGLIKDATGGSDLLAPLALAAAPTISAVVPVSLGHDRRLERIPPLHAVGEADRGASRPALLLPLATRRPCYTPRAGGR
jgi:MFS transporter, ACS family, tartrate transporter